MLPANQGLEAEDLAADARLRLIVQGQFVVLEETEHAASFALGARERGVGVADQRGGVGAIDGKYRDADAQAERTE